MPVQCLTITVRLQILCILTCILIPYILAHFVRSGLLEVKWLLRRCRDVPRIIKNILKDSFCSVAKKINKPYNPIKKKPSWIRSKVLDTQTFFNTKAIVNKNNLHTVCQEANCPNITECWSKKHATFMIMGDTCTRGCAFCDVKTGKPGALDSFEHLKISKAVKELNLNHVVITSVDRDDLEDGGAEHFKNVVLETKKKNPNTTIEVLTPDFLRKGDSFKKVLEANPDVFNHNIETVPSLYLQVRPGSRYFGSIKLLESVKKIKPNMFTKSGIMVGLGENKNEIFIKNINCISSYHCLERMDLQA